MAVLSSQPLAAFAILALSISSIAEAHTVLTYPGWRGNNLKTSAEFPLGMQWQYPCGGLSTTTNRTYWPVGGNGAIAFQPGWFAGNSRMLMYINIGLGEQPSNYSVQLTPMFQINGPSDGPYPGTFCLPQVQLPSNVTPRSGDKATIQLVQAHKHGAPAYNCVDIEFTDDQSKVLKVDQNNCFNSTDIQGFHVDVVRSGGNPTSSAPAQTSTTSTPTPTRVPSPGKKRETGRLSGLMSFLLML